MQQTTTTVFNAYEYERGLGQPNPIWKPVPQHYYPLEYKQVCFYIIFVWGIIFAVLGIFVGFLYWCVSDTATYVLVWCIISCVVTCIGLWLLYTGGKDRRRQQKELIQQTNRKQQAMIQGKK